MVVGVGFEPTNPKEQIYSLPRLASSLPDHDLIRYQHSAFLFYYNNNLKASLFLHFIHFFLLSFFNELLKVINHSQKEIWT